MTPYFAVIKDSFREALASRVLWIMLILITLLLLALLPVGLETTLSYRLEQRDVYREAELAKTLNGPKAKSDPLLKHIHAKLSDDLKKEIAEFDKDPSSRQRRHRLRRHLARELTEMLENDDFYDTSLWKDKPLSAEGQTLLDKGIDRFSEQEQRRFNRLALQVALPRHINVNNQSSAAFTYAGYNPGFPAMPTKAVNELLKNIVTGFMDLLVGRLGVFAAILVTASIIPNTFDAGSVYLLLSKPISRPLLYLSKFIGGCSFVLINAIYLIVGCWLVIGIRLDVWNHRVLWCIPIFLFLFVIYYSVSGLAGLIWRNTVVCVVVTFAFWFLCFVVDTAKTTVLDTFVHNPNRVNGLVAIGDDLIATTNSNSIQRWNSSANAWDQLTGPSGGFPGAMFGIWRLGPIHDVANNRLIMLKDQSQIVSMQPNGAFAEEEFGAIPENALGIFTGTDGAVYVVGSANVFRISDELRSVEPGQKILGFTIPSLDTHKNFTPMKIDLGVVEAGDSVIAFDVQTKRLVVWNSKTLHVFAQTENGFEFETKSKLLDESQEGILAASGGRAALALEDGSVRVVELPSLEMKQNPFHPFDANQPRYALGSPTGSKFAIVFHSQQLWVYDAETNRDHTADVIGQNDITAATFSESGQLLVADRINRVRSYVSDSFQVGEVRTPNSTGVEMFSRYLLDPLYYDFPKQTQLGATISYILNGRETVSPQAPEASLQSTQIQIDPWGPVWSSAAFALVVLTLSCVYIYRQDY